MRYSRLHLPIGCDGVAGGTNGPHDPPTDAQRRDDRHGAPQWCIHPPLAQI